MNKRFSCCDCLFWGFHFYDFFCYNAMSKCIPLLWGNKGARLWFVFVPSRAALEPTRGTFRLTRGVNLRGIQGQFKGSLSQPEGMWAPLVSLWWVIRGKPKQQSVTSGHRHVLNSNKSLGSGYHCNTPVSYYLNLIYSWWNLFYIVNFNSSILRTVCCHGDIISFWRLLSQQHKWTDWSG